MRYATIGTAGHIDHGKSQLVKALTGTDPDRLKEEKERGITIDIGFAYLDLPSGIHCAIVDVPGHEDFIRNMLAGVGGIDLVLLIIAADEGVKPQTREHMDICRLLAVPVGIVTVTKSDLGDPELREVLDEEIRSLVRGSSLESAPVIRTSARTGEGIEELRQTIDKALSDRSAGRPEGQVFRLPIDRVFVMQGFGTVVTGTIASGRVTVGDEIEAFSLSSAAVTPPVLTSRVRGIQSHKHRIDTAMAGQRVALNLQGVRAEEVHRGDLLSSPKSLQPTSKMDVHLTTVGALPHSIRTHSVLNFHSRTFSTAARVLLHDRKELGKGESCLATLNLDRPAAQVSGDRFVLLGSGGHQRTVGGGVILDPLAGRRKYGDKRSALLSLVGAPPESALTQLALLHPGPLSSHEVTFRLGIVHDRFQSLIGAVEAAGSVIRLSGDSIVLTEGYRAIADKSVEILSAFHSSTPYESGMKAEEFRHKLKVQERFFLGILRRLTTDGIVRLDADRVALPRFKVTVRGQDVGLRDRLLNLYREAGFAPPTLNDVRSRFGESNLGSVLQLLEREGPLVRVDPEIYFSREAVEALKGAILEFFKTHSTMNPADLKDLAGLTRKHAIPLLEYFDRVRLTRREGNVRKLHSAPSKVK